MYYSYDLPYIDHGYMTEKSVKAVMDEVRPYERVDMDKLTDDEMDEYIDAWLSGMSREYVEEFGSDTIMADPFFIDTYISLWRSPQAYAETITKRARDIFKQERTKTILNPFGLSLAKQLEENVNRVLEKEGDIEEAA